MDKDRKYLHTVGAGVVLPFLQAVATGFIFGLLALVLALAFRWGNPWAWSGVVFVSVLALTWLQLQRRWHELISWSTKIVRADDLSERADGLLVRLAAEVEGNYHEIDTRLPATLAQMQDLAAGLLAGDPFTERCWTGYGRPFSLNGFRELRSELVKRGLLAIANPKDSRQGYLLTVVGKQTMRAFLTDTPSPIEPSDLVKL